MIASNLQHLIEEAAPFEPIRIAVADAAHRREHSAIVPRLCRPDHI